MNINSMSTAFDYRLLCEAKNDVLGKRDFNQIWENVNEAFESFNSKHITLERIQDVVKGYLLFLTEPMEDEIKLAAAIKVAENAIVKPWKPSRPEGYYWIKRKDNEWEVAMWYIFNGEGAAWFVTGKSHPIVESEIESISEIQLTIFNIPSTKINKYIESRLSPYKDEEENPLIEYKCLECGNWEYEVSKDDGICYTCFMLYIEGITQEHEPITLDKKKELLQKIEQKAIYTYISGWTIPYKHEHSELLNTFLSGVTWGYNTRSVWCDKVELRYIELLKKEVLKDIGGSLSSKMDYWEEYCKQNEIYY